MKRPIALHPLHLILNAILVFISATAPLRAELADPQALIRTTIEDLRSNIVRDKANIEREPNLAVELVDRIISPHVDTDRVGRLVLGKHWNSASPQQRDAFVAAYKRLLLRTYAVHATNYTDVSIDYLPLRMSEGDKGLTTVRTRVTRNGKPPTNVDYRVHQSGDSWKVYDVTADGISLVATFRAAIDADIKQNGIDQMIARLEHKNNQPLAARH